MGADLNTADYEVLFTGITGLTVVFILACAILVGGNRMLGRSTKHTLMTCLVLTLGGVVFQWLSWIASGNPELNLYQRIAVAAEFSAAPAIPVAAALAVKRNKQARVMMGVILANMVLEAVSVFVPLVFVVNEQGLYERGPAYPVYIAAYVVGVVYLLICGTFAVRRSQGANYLALGSIVLCLATGIVPQLMAHNAQTSWTAIALSLALYYIYHNDAVQKTDELTGLLNRRTYERHVADLGGPAQIYLLDLDDFKSVNDVLGHAVGDEVLSQTAALIRRSFGRAGLCYRTGGDEFVVIVDGVHARSPREPQSRVDYFLEALEAAREKNPSLCSVSVGYALLERGGDVDEAFVRADTMMYEAKRASGTTRGGRAKAEAAE